jgi:hypothetical protein
LIGEALKKELQHMAGSGLTSKTAFIESAAGRAAWAKVGFETTTLVATKRLTIVYYEREKRGRPLGFEIGLLPYQEAAIKS